MGARKRVIIVGAGFGGFAAARALKRAPFDVLVVDRANHHLFQPLLYQVASAALSPGDIAMPIREVLRHQRNATVIMGEVAAVDLAGCQVELADGERLAYDWLILAPGTRHAYFGHPEWEASAPGLKTLTDALRIREQILKSFELAERAPNDAELQPLLTFVIVGGGPTGVELAGAIAEIAHQTMLRDFRRIDPRRTRVLLIEATERVLPTFPPELSEKARRQLQDLRVEVLTGRKVTEVAPEGVRLDSEFLPARNVLWAAGNQASPLLATLGVERDRQGRIVVGPDCSIPGHPEVFVIGDAANCRGPDGRPFPGIATVAVQQARHVARILRRDLPIGRRPDFRFRDRGVMATIGKERAVAVLWGRQFAGFPAWLAWSFVHLLYLVGYRNRALVLLEWIVWYVTGRRGVRLIHRPLEEGEDGPLPLR